MEHIKPDKKLVNLYYKKLNPFSSFKGFIVLFSFYFLFLTSCTPDPPPVLTYKDRQMLDSLYKLEIDSLKPILDSMCDLRHDSAVEYKVDSIMEVRQAEIDKYLKRIKKEQE